MAVLLHVRRYDGKYEYALNVWGSAFSHRLKVRAQRCDWTARLWFRSLGALGVDNRRGRGQARVVSRALALEQRNARGAVYPLGTVRPVTARQDPGRPDPTVASSSIHPSILLAQNLEGKLPAKYSRDDIYSTGTSHPSQTGYPPVGGWTDIAQRALIDAHQGWETAAYRAPVGEVTSMGTYILLHCRYNTPLYGLAAGFAHYGSGH